MVAKLALALSLLLLTFVPVAMAEEPTPSDEECVTGYNTEAFSNVCILEEDSAFRFSFPSNCIYPIGDTCVPIISQSDEPDEHFYPVTIYIEVACNTIPCECTGGPLTLVHPIILCTPFS